MHLFVFRLSTSMLLRIAPHSIGNCWCTLIIIFIIFIYFRSVCFSCTPHLAMIISMLVFSNGQHISTWKTPRSSGGPASGSVWNGQLSLIFSKPCRFWFWWLCEVSPLCFFVLPLAPCMRKMRVLLQDRDTCGILDPNVITCLSHVRLGLDFWARVLLCSSGSYG